jgi:hypothetical protein
MPSGLHHRYVARVMEWQAAALRAASRDVGCVEGTLLHHWHGQKRKRYYVERWETLRRHQYDPDRDIYRDAAGVLALTGNKPDLRDDLRRYFRSRDEDSRDEE